LIPAVCPTGIVWRVSMPATLTEVAAAITDLLQDGRAWDEDALTVALIERGVDLGTNPEDTVADVLDSDDLPLVVPVDDDAVALLPALLRGRTLTHRLTAVEVELDVVVLGGDLSALWWLTDSEIYHRLVDGTELVQAVRGLDDEVLDERGVPADLPDDFVWLLPRGTLERTGLGVGDLAGFTVRDGGFELAAVPDVAGAAEIGQRLADNLGLRGEDEPDEISEVLWRVCAQDPDFLVLPVPPLASAIEAAGIPCEGDFIAPPGFDFSGWRVGKRLDRVASLHRLEDDEALAVLALTGMYDDVTALFDTAQAAAAAGESFHDLFAEAAPQGDGTDPGAGEHPDSRAGGLHRQLVRDLVPFLDDPRVLSALLVETIGAGRDGAAALGLFAETLEAQVPRGSRASLRWLRGMALDRLGRVLDAEEAFEAALTLDGDHELTLYALARYASDRGDAERGLSLLRRAGAAPDDQMVVLLTHFRPAERTDIGRNQPCWCGSGRKYKVCHRNRETLPLADRAAWLYQKAAAFLTDGPWREQVLDVAEIRAGHWDGDGAVWQALNEGLSSDLVLFEGGAFEEFVAERGVLLPDDERLLADQWLLTERSVHEIESVTPGEGFTARDLRTGERVEVRERTASHSLAVGELICARLVPAGDTIQIFGGLEMVTLRERDALIAMLDEGAAPEQLVALLSARFAPPQLQNTEGEPLVMCEATLRSDDPAGLMAALDSAYDRVDGERARWIEHVTTDGLERVRATLELAGVDLHVETNSEARLDRVLAKVQELQPGVTLTAEARRPAGDVQEAMSRSPVAAPGAIDPEDPSVAAALTEFIRSQELAWLDAPVPALSGATPREAAADPTRRPDLLRLLDSYDIPTAPGAVSMDPARLRSALGLG
jgi:tetratricopeptide (TPR) repeat protein